MKYLVMECHPAYAVLLDEESRFVRAANLHYSVGQTVTDPVLMQDHNRAARITQKTVLRIAAAAACLLLLSAAGFGIYLKSRKKPDTTQSLVVMFERTRYEIELNSSGEVLSVLSGGPQGQQSRESYDGQHLSTADFLGAVMKDSLDQGKIGEQQTVQVYLSSDDDALYAECKTQIEQEAAKLRLNADVQEITAPAPNPEPPVPDKEHDDPKPAPAPPKETNAPPKPEKNEVPAADTEKPAPPAANEKPADPSKPPVPSPAPADPAKPAEQPPAEDKPAQDPPHGPQPPLTPPALPKPAAPAVKGSAEMLPHPEPDAKIPAPVSP